MRTREAMLWELEERQIHEKHQLAKRHVKDMCFMQRHQMIVRHEKELDQVKRYDAEIFVHVNFTHPFQLKSSPNLMKSIFCNVECYHAKRMRS